MPAMSDYDSLADGISIETNPFEREIITDELLAFHEKRHRENPHPVFRGPPWSPPRPVAPSPPTRKPRTPRLLDGIGPVRYLEGLRRLPNGRVYSQRLEVQRLIKTTVPPAATLTPPRPQTRRPPKPAPAVSRPSKTGRVQKKASAGRPRRRTRSAKR